MVPVVVAASSTGVGRIIVYIPVCHGLVSPHLFYCSELLATLVAR